MTDGAIPILLVEDSAEDVEAMIRAFQKLGLNHRISRCETADDALEHLRRCAAGEREWPRIVLLDLNLPGTDGRDLLYAIRADPRTKSLPVVVLTSSINPRDIDLCYATGANAYMVKPMGIDELRHTIAVFTGYWLSSWVRLPTVGRV